MPQSSVGGGAAPEEGGYDGTSPDESIYSSPNLKETVLLSSQIIHLVAQMSLLSQDLFIVLTFVYLISLPLLMLLPHLVIPFITLSLILFESSLF